MGGFADVSCPKCRTIPCVCKSEELDKLPRELRAEIARLKAELEEAKAKDEAMGKASAALRKELAGFRENEDRLLAENEALRREVEIREVAKDAALETLDEWAKRAEAAERERDEARDLYTETEERLCHALTQLDSTARERDDNRAGWVAAIGERNAAQAKLRGHIDGENARWRDEKAYAQGVIRELRALCGRARDKWSEHWERGQEHRAGSDDFRAFMAEARTTIAALDRAAKGEA